MSEKKKAKSNKCRRMSLYISFFPLDKIIRLRKYQYFVILVEEKSNGIKILSGIRREYIAVENQFA